MLKARRAMKQSRAGDGMYAERMYDDLSYWRSEEAHASRAREICVLYDEVVDEWRTSCRCTCTVDCLSISVCVYRVVKTGKEAVMWGRWII